MHSSTFRRGAAIGLAAALLLAGCGTSEKESSGGGGGGSGSGSGGSSSSGEVRGVTDDTITIGGIAPLTSASGGYPGADVGAEARFQRANEEGGIHGRTIEYLGTEDDTEDGTKNLDLAREMVDQGAFAIVPMLGAGFLPATSDYLDSEQVPSVGWGFMPGQCGAEDSYGFGFNGCIQPPGGELANTSLAAQIMEELGGEATVAIVSDDTANSTEGLETVKGAFLAEGAEVVYAKPNVPTSEQVDYTPFVQDVMTSNDGGPPDLVVFNSLFSNTVGITAGLRGAGFEGETLNYIAYVPGLLEQSPDVAAALDGSYVSTQFLPTEFGGDAIEQMEADFAAVDPDAQITLGAALTYWMADVFVQMLDAVGEDLTPETFGEVINGGWTYEPEGDPAGLGPIEYPKGHGEPAPCSALVKIDGTSYEPISPLECSENVPLSEIEGA